MRHTSKYLDLVSLVIVLLRSYQKPQIGFPFDEQSQVSKNGLEGSGVTNSAVRPKEIHTCNLQTH